ncbi:hypothetical protein CONPUDRAFT_145742 [Coniophora puteana RWD-64-598 SS2]|uniref:F-box domain-containing protein n=1 Tax=Coniophora puteana (strain RWD-64-598) TaxID=741705 RepID=A0A5M3MHI0_CONPW|nr:uncharacterized protein CONPUDRAFT_145742 [Coniophora puteana RWD-64-598 SS2]EIW78563.1 hypothetical protein CONPUDRAFT_145742 [Coniophora puteana RWD-64-598 SS2]
MRSTTRFVTRLWTRRNRAITGTSSSSQPMLSTHRALSINEVIFNIATYVEAKKDIASLARVSRALSEPALDVLWSNLDSFIPLLQCLPSNLVGGIVEDNTLFLSLERPFTTADWQTLVKYARRVVSLTWTSKSFKGFSIRLDGQRVELTSITIDGALFTVLSVPPVSRLFPRLCRLTWKKRSGQGTYSLFRAMLSPSVTHLDMSSFAFSISDQEALSLVAILGDLCPSMQHFKWTGAPLLPRSLPSNYTDQAFSSVACAWKRLTSLSCPALHQTALLQLSSSSYLRDITCTLAHSSPETRTLAINRPAFPALTALALSSPPRASLAIIAKFISKIAISPSSLDFSADTTTELALTELLTAVTEHCNKDTLTSLRVSENYDRSSVIEGGLALSYATLGPLSRFRNLTRLEIDTHRNILLDDNALLEMAGSFPDLKMLHFNSGYAWRTRSQVTLVGIRQLIARLASIETLALAVDAETQPLTMSAVAEANRALAVQSARATSTLTSLNLLDSRIDLNSTLVVAAFLSDFLPNTDTSLSWNTKHSEFGDADEQGQRWTDVWAAMDVIWQVREQEKAKWTNNRQLCDGFSGNV